MTCVTSHPIVQVEFSPDAWRQIGFLRWEAFHRVRQGLHRVAARMSESLSRAGDERSSFFLAVVDGWLARCELDKGRRVLTLLELAPTGSADV